MSLDVTSFVDVAQGLGEPRTLVSFLCHDVFCTVMCLKYFHLMLFDDFYACIVRLIIMVKMEMIMVK